MSCYKNVMYRGENTLYHAKYLIIYFKIKYSSTVHYFAVIVNFSFKSLNWNFVGKI